MISQLYIFNPEHDLALANDDPNFMAPQSALQLKNDLEMLPLWYCQSGNAIYCESNHVDWLCSMQKYFLQLMGVNIYNTNELTCNYLIKPWGWDNVFRNSILKLGIVGSTSQFSAGNSLPTILELEQIRRLSHRRVAIQAMNFVRTHCPEIPVPPSAVELTDLNAVASFVSEHSTVVLKSPWSGSGKGLSWVRSGLTASHNGWCKRIIQKQGSVIAETIYDVKQNFAMLFSCENMAVSFAGYSLFETEKGIYRNNILMSDKAIHTYLTDNFIPEMHLQEVKAALSEFISITIAPYYSGMLGVDMFVYEHAGKMHLHPCVEINLRMTMGAVARSFYDSFVAEKSTGVFYIDHVASKGWLIEDHVERQKKHPLEVESGRIVQGYLALNEITEHTQYRVRVEL